MGVLRFFVFLLSHHLVLSSPCSREESVDLGSSVIYENGSIIHDGAEYLSDSWYESDEDGVTVRLGCPCLGRTCLWKCCRLGQAYIGTSCNDTDLEAANPFSPTVYEGKVVLDRPIEFFLMYNRLCAERYLVDSNSPDEEIYLQENATLYEIVQGRQLWHPSTTFCIDVMMDDGSSPRIVAAVCYPDSPDESSEDHPALYIAYAVGLLISVPFLLATFLVYAFIPELRNLHGMCLMAYCAGLIVAYPFLAYLKMSIGDVGVNKTGCLVVAFVIYYSFQTSFFWLNVMCFDIWRTFSGYRGGGSTKRRENRRFVMYGIYAWGIPLLLLGCTIGMQFADLPSGVITPEIGVKKCWFASWQSELVYFNTPVLVLVVCNLVLFSVTAYRIRSIRQETAILKGSESARSDKLMKDKQRFGLYIKLFVVMGVNWSIEMISFIVGGSNWYWIIVDLSNIALGFFIFMIFVWKNKVRNLVTKRWRTIRGEQTPTETGARWATQSSSMPTEDTRISTDDSTLKLRPMH